jgi:hypothetical protein
MEFEIRRVPKNWQHPKRWDGRLKPQHDEDFDTACERWKAGFLAWERRDAAYFHFQDTWMFDRGGEYWEYVGNPPDRDFFHPYWPDAERTHFQMYEILSEGTPISPVMGSPEALARWLAENPDDAGVAATYDDWLSVCKGEPAGALAGSLVA